MNHPRSILCALVALSFVTLIGCPQPTPHPGPLPPDASDGGYVPPRPPPLLLLWWRRSLLLRCPSLQRLLPQPQPLPLWLWWWKVRCLLLHPGAPGYA